MHPDPVSEASRLTRIDDPADERLAAYRDIRERDLVGREGRFVAEGKVVLNVLFGSSAFQAESVLILESRLDGTTDIIERVPPHVWRDPCRADSGAGREPLQRPGKYLPCQKA